MRNRGVRPRAGRDVGTHRWKVGFGLALIMLGQGGCASGPDPQHAAAKRYLVTPPGGFPFDVFLTPWTDGAYIITRAGQGPIYLAPDNKGGYVIHGPQQTTSYAIPRPDGGFTVMTPGAPSRYLLPQEGGYMLAAPGELPTIITPQP